MWSSLSAPAEAWEAALAAERAPGAGAQQAAENAIIAACRFNQVFIGGDDSACLLQVIGAADSGGDDLLASVLLPEEDVLIAYTVRGPSVQQLITSFWGWRPQAPVLIEQAGQYLPIMMRLPNTPWTEGVLSAEWMTKVQRSAEEAESVEIYVPGESDCLRALTARPESTASAILDGESETVL